jgi:sugar phosphate isomerase/epimerase
MKQGVELLKPLATRSVRLLADLFHMNIEETTIEGGLIDAGAFLGHVHFVDSNRQAVGHGHMSYEPIAGALRSIGYAGYASAEAFPVPDAITTAKSTIDGFRRWLR